MRKFIALLLLAGAGYYLYTHQELWRKTAEAADTPAATTNSFLQKPFAWKVVSRDRPNGPIMVVVEITDGNRWRVESKEQGKPGIFVAVSDGSTAVATRRDNSSEKTTMRASVETMNPRPVMNQILELAAKTFAMSQQITPKVTEQCDGKTCLRTSVDFQGVLVRLWLDARSGFPVCLSGSAKGAYIESHYSALELDFARRSSEFFDTHSTQPLFRSYLPP